MKNILVLTDFSIRADYAANYATHVAIKTNANILLCHAIEAPSPITDGNGISWPIPTYMVLKQECSSDLTDLKQKLERLIKNDAGMFKPTVKYTADFGPLAIVASKLVADHKIDLVVMGCHHANLLSRILTGNHAHSIIDQLNCPVLLIPETYEFKEIHSIAYATDLTFNNANIIQYLSGIAEGYGARISVNHITTLSEDSSQYDLADQFFRSERAVNRYKNVSYRNIKRTNVKTGLLEMTQYLETDMLALVHKRYNFFEGLFHKSVSKQLADSSSVPVLILPHSFSENVADITGEQLDSFCYEADER